MEYPKVCNISGWKYYLYSHLEKILIEMVIQFFIDRNESFDDYYPCSKKDKCNLEHVFNLIELFVSI
jgi:putative transposase